MEPQILIIGLSMEMLTVLQEELRVFKRKISLATSRDDIMEMVEKGVPDFVVITADLPDDQRVSMENFIHKLNPELPVFSVDRTESSGPFDMINFTNRMAVEWKAGKL